MSKTIEVDTRTFIRFWLVLLGFVVMGFLIYKAMAGLIIIGIAAFLAIAMRPLAKKIGVLTKRGATGSVSALAYILIIAVVTLIVSVAGPVVIGETAQFVGQLPTTFENSLGGWDGINTFGQSIGIDDLQTEILNGIKSFSTSFVDNLGDMVMVGVGAISQVLTTVILVLVLTLFFMIEGPGIMNNFWQTIERKRNKSEVKPLKRLVDRMVDVIAIYVTRQVMVAILDGCVVTVAVFLLSMIFGFSSSLALPMGLIAMVFYLIPMFGPIISCALISLVLLFSSPIAAVIFLVFYIVYAQIENNVIAPKIQGNALNLPATLILVAIIIGMYMFGLVGAIVAIPIAGCIKVLFEEWPNLREIH